LEKAVEKVERKEKKGGEELVSQPSSVERKDDAPKRVN
jgi:hypothetical protein